MATQNRIVGLIAAFAVFGMVELATPSTSLAQDIVQIYDDSGWDIYCAVDIGGLAECDAYHPHHGYLYFVTDPYDYWGGLCYKLGSYLYICNGVINYPPIWNQQVWENNPALNMMLCTLNPFPDFGGGAYGWINWAFEFFYDPFYAWGALRCAFQEHPDLGWNYAFGW